MWKSVALSHCFLYKSNCWLKYRSGWKQKQWRKHHVQKIKDLIKTLIMDWLKQMSLSGPMERTSVINTLLFLVCLCNSFLLPPHILSMCSHWLQDKSVRVLRAGEDVAISELEIHLRAVDPFRFALGWKLPSMDLKSWAHVSGQRVQKEPFSKSSPWDLVISWFSNRWIGMLTARNDGAIALDG